MAPTSKRQSDTLHTPPTAPPNPAKFNDFQQQISSNLDIAIQAVTTTAESTDPVLKALAPALAGLLAVVQLQQQFIGLLFSQQNLFHSATAPVDTPQFDVADEKEKRRSIVISGLGESEGKPSERNAGDAKKVVDLLDEIDVEANIVSCYRMGLKKGSKGRLLKVVLSTSQQQRQTLMNSRKLKGSQTFNGVYIRPSLNQEERAREAKLWNDFKKLKSENRGYVKFVGGPPGHPSRKLEIVQKTQ